MQLLLVILLFVSITTLIKSEVTLLPHLACGCYRYCVPVELQSELY